MKIRINFKALIKKVIFLLILIISCLVELYLFQTFDDFCYRYGIIDKNRNVVVDYKYNYINTDNLYNNQKYIIAYQENVFNGDATSFYIDVEGNEYRNEMPKFINNRATAYSVSIGKEGYIDCDWNKISQFIYDTTYDYKGNFAKVEINGKYGMIDYDGNQVISCNYDQVYSITDSFFICDKGDDSFIVNDNDKIIGTDEGFYDINDFKEINECEDCDIDYTKNCIIVEKDGKYGIFDKEGVKVVDFKYEEFRDITNSKSETEAFCVKENGKEYIIDNSGKIIWENNDNNIWPSTYVDGYIIFGKLNLDEFYMMDSKGNIIIDNMSIITAPKNDCFFTIDKKENASCYDLNGDLILDNLNVGICCGNGKYFVSAKKDTILSIIYYSAIGLFGIVSIFCVLKIFNFKKSNKKV